MNIKKIYKRYFVYEEDSLENAIRTMLSYSVSGIAVVNENEELVGVLSAKDFLKSLLSHKYHNSGLGRINDYTVKDPVVLLENETENQVIDLFVGKSPHHYYPIVDKNGKFLGTVYRNDLLEYINNLDETTW
jgi:CBS domain-containing protein